MDINGGADGLPELQLNVKDVNGDGQPDNLEDTDDSSRSLRSSSPTSAPRWPMAVSRLVEQVVVTVDPQYGHFLDKNGQPVSTLTVNDPADLAGSGVRAQRTLQRQVPLAVTVDILDTATTGPDRGAGAAT